jgi:hypothetical protein
LENILLLPCFSWATLCGSVSSGTHMSCSSTPSACWLACECRLGPRHLRLPLRPLHVKLLNAKSLHSTAEPSSLFIRLQQQKNTN